MKKSMTQWLLSFFIFFLTACSLHPVYLSYMWKSPDSTHKKYKKALVVAASGMLERRLIFEDIFTNKFKEYGVEAMPASLVIKTGDQRSKNTIQDAAQRYGADCIVITGLIDIHEEEKVIAGGERTEMKIVSLYPYYEDLNSRYELYYAETIAREPPRVVSSFKVSFETRVFDAATGKLAWEGITTSTDLDDLNETTEEFAELIATTLSRQGMI